MSKKTFKFHVEFDMRYVLDTTILTPEKLEEIHNQNRKEFSGIDVRTPEGFEEMCRRAIVSVIRNVLRTELNDGDYNESISASPVKMTLIK